MSYLIIRRYPLGRRWGLIYSQQVCQTGSSHIRIFISTALHGYGPISIIAQRDRLITKCYRICLLEVKPNGKEDNMGPCRLLPSLFHALHEAKEEIIITQVNRQRPHRMCSKSGRKTVLLVPSLGRKSIDRSFSETRSSFALGKESTHFHMKRDWWKHQCGRNDQHLSQPGINNSSHRHHLTTSLGFCH